MKIIQSTLLGDTKMMYHKIKTIVPLDSHADEGGSATITVWYKGDIKAGDVLEWYHTEPYLRVESILERRNHKGKFINPDDAVNSFWHIKGSFVRRGTIKIEDYEQ